MRIYLHMNVDSFTNTYLVADEESRCALIIDPGKPTSDVLKQIEIGDYRLCALLITHNHAENTRGIATLQRIYDLPVYAAANDIASSAETTIQGDGVLRFGGITVGYFSVPGHTTDSLVYKIGSALFTGDVISAGEIGETTSRPARDLLCRGIRAKIFCQSDDCVIMAGRGPLTSVGAEKRFNMAACQTPPRESPFSGL